MQKTSAANVLNDLNRDLLEQCKEYQSRDKAFVEHYGTLDIDKEIEQIPHGLWNAITMITTSYTERNGKQIATGEQHKKRLRQYFLLCCMMFCVNDSCSMPMHVLITDLVDSLGGTKLLIQALNKLGVCSSGDIFNDLSKGNWLLQQKNILAASCLRQAALQLFQWTTLILFTAMHECLKVHRIVAGMVLLCS